MSTPPVLHRKRYCEERSKLTLKRLPPPLPLLTKTRLKTHVSTPDIMGNAANAEQRWRTLAGTPEGYDYSDISFCQLDLGDAASLARALSGCDLVVHTAGPFQRKVNPEVLEAAIEAKARYASVYDPHNPLVLLSVVIHSVL